MDSTGEPAKRLVPCKMPAQGMGHRACPLCHGTGLLEFDPTTGELTSCDRTQNQEERIYGDRLLDKWPPLA